MTMACLCVQAQTINTDGKLLPLQSFNVIPGIFSSDNKSKIVNFVEDEETGECHFDIYNGDIEKIKTINYVKPSNAQGYTITKKRKEDINISYEDEDSTFLIARLTSADSFRSKADAMEFIKAFGYTTIDIIPASYPVKTIGGMLISAKEFWCVQYYQPETYGNIYPEKLFIFDQNHLYFASIEYEKRYTGDWEETREDAASYYNYVMEPFTLKYSDYDEWQSTRSASFGLTQTLFNNDNSYEYIRPILEIAERYTTESDRDRDGEIDYIQTEYGPQQVGFEIVKENGEVLQSVKFGDNTTYDSESEISVIKIGGKQYLCVGLYRSGDGDYNIFYAFTPGTTSVRQVSEPIKTSVRQNNEYVTIDVVPSSVSRELSVTGINGITTYRQTIPAGQTSMRINSKRLSKGINIININGEKVDNCKVIIK